MSEQALCEVVASFLLNCIMEIDIISDWETLPLKTTRHVNLALQAILIGHAK